jgi:hypothetical protein
MPLKYLYLYIWLYDDLKEHFYLKVFFSLRHLDVGDPIKMLNIFGNIKRSFSIMESNVQFYVLTLY